MKRAILLAAFITGLCGAAEFPTVKPESVGFSSQRLEYLHNIIQEEIDQQHLAGAVTILARHGQIVEYRTYGQRDIAAAAPMTKDVIFRAYSMTKPVTGVAMMILYEQGKWLPWQPVAKYIPEFAKLKVFNGFDGNGNMMLVDPDHPPTVGEVMSHSAGFSYGFSHRPVDNLYQDKKVLESANLHEMIEKLSSIPLNYQPGQGWIYSVGMDIEGYMVEKLSGQSLPDFMQDHIFGPLGMKDSGFYVPAEKSSRLAINYEQQPDGRLRPSSRTGFLSDFSKMPTMPSGGGGMVTTAEDYYRFAQMLANGGQLKGNRLLAPASVTLMSTNHLGPSIINGNFGAGLSIMRPGFGYGFNCAVIFDPPTAGMSDGKGTFFWDGAAGTWFWVDPTNDIVFVSMIQRIGSGDNHPLEYRSHAAVYSALVDPSK